MSNQNVKKVKSQQNDCENSEKSSSERPLHIQATDDPPPPTNELLGNPEDHPSRFWIRVRDMLGRNPKSAKMAEKPPNRKINILSKDQLFLHNSIRTAKYSLATFLPIFFFEQFRRYNNLFFLFIMLLQQIPDVSPTGRWTTLVPLSFIFFVSGLKELFEDWKRHVADGIVNNTLAKVYEAKTSSWIKQKWRNIRVGDLVLVEKDQFFPSDLILLASKEPNGFCYIETSNLDGETNLKARSALDKIDEQITSQDGKSSKFLNLDKLSKSPIVSGRIECDPPNKLLYEFVGRLMCKNKPNLPVGPNNILLRGAQMRNTEWALGVVIYTGHESKLMMNSMTAAPLKQSHVEIITNQQILALLGILGMMVIISTIFSFTWLRNHAEHWYLSELGEENLKNVSTVLMNFIILYNNLVPISLQVTLEMVRVIQAYFIDKDLQMFDDETQTFAQARTSSLNEELGQVRYILSDKTGTLTRNVMEFKMCCISGVIYGESKLSQLSQIVKNCEKNWEVVRDFLTLLAVCHTVIPEPVKSSTSDSGEKNQSASLQIQYSASSPDEAALVKGAQKIGYEFRGRTPQKVIINALGKLEVYEILQVLEFNSDRKRMSVVTRTPEGVLKLYIKGADSMVAKGLSAEEKEKFFKTEELLSQFASQGFRTLCCAYVELSEAYYQNWLKRYTKALLMQSNQIDVRGENRDFCINEMMDEIESNLILLGATAIEDKLQIGVPETIEKLMRAGIKLWMLTGDKQETATNIAYSCNLLNDIQDNDAFHVVNERTPEGTREALIAADAKLVKAEHFTLIIDSESLHHVLNSDIQSAFMAVALKSRSVICCRISPAQKADIVQAVRKSTNSIVLAIGDGANDVAMIRAANVGIGISGQEGLQAVHSSDYSIAQFRFLARLLLVHGSWSLLRVCKLTLFSFYKNIALYVIQLWYASVSAWSAQPIFERWCLSSYNVFFTAWPPLAMGLFDRVCSAEAVLENPELYSDQWDRFCVPQFWSWIVHGIAHSLIIFWLTYFSFGHDTPWQNGMADGGYLFFGTVLYTYVVVTVSLKAAMEIHCWNYWTKVSIIGSMLTWFIFLNIYSQIWPTFFMGPDIIAMDEMLWTSSLFWFGMFVIPPMALIFDFTQKVTQRTLHQTLVDRVMEMEEAKRTKRGEESSFLERTSHLVANTIEAILGIRTHKAKPESPQKNVEETYKKVEISKNTIKETSRNDTEIDIAHGYSFSQEEKNMGNHLSQGNVIRMYDRKNSKRPKCESKSSGSKSNVRLRQKDAIGK